MSNRVETVKKEIKILRVQSDSKRKVFRVNIPKEVVEQLGIEKRQSVKVILDTDNRRIIYALI